jgi:PAS domain S-box-containing protein
MTDQRDGAAGGLNQTAMLNLLEDLREENEARKKREKELRDAEARYRQLFDLSPDGIVILDPETTRPLEFNEMAHRQLGYGREEFARLRLKDIDAREAPEESRRRIDGILARGRDDFETLHRTRGGEIRNVQVTARIMEILGKPVYYCVWRDITERKRAEEALAESEKLYRSLFQNMMNGFAYCRMHFDDEGRPSDFTYLSVNEAFETQTGLKNVVGKRVTEVIPGIRKASPELFEIYGRVARGGKPERFEDYIDPLKMWFTVSVYSPQPDFFVAVFDVITERKRAEEALRASLKEKETLLREIHHRVKNNMQIISSLFNLQAVHIKDPDALRALREGQNRIRSMALIHEKLYKSHDLSKVEFASYIRSLSTYLFQFFKVNPARVRLESDLQDIHLDINSAIPCGLLVNELVSNALKHAFPEERRGVISIGLRREDDGTIRLRVADDGVGLPEDFDIRRSASFGLQIVDLLIGQLDGRIEVDKKLGTSFTISFRELEYKART